MHYSVTSQSYYYWNETASSLTLTLAHRRRNNAVVVVGRRATTTMALLPSLLLQQLLLIVLLATTTTLSSSTTTTALLSSCPWSSSSSRCSRRSLNHPSPHRSLSRSFDASFSYTSVPSSSFPLFINRHRSGSHCRTTTLAAPTVDAPFQVEEEVEERTTRNNNNNKKKQGDRGLQENNNVDEEEYYDLEYLIDPRASREWNDPYHILLLGSTFAPDDNNDNSDDGGSFASSSFSSSSSSLGLSTAHTIGQQRQRPPRKVMTLAYVSSSLEYVLGMPYADAYELSSFAKEHGMSCVGTWPRTECLSLGKQLQQRDLVCRVVPYCVGGQRSWQAAKDAATTPTDATSVSSSLSNLYED